MTTEEHLRVMCGDMTFQIASLRGQVDALQGKIDELEKTTPDRSNVHEMKVG